MYVCVYARARARACVCVCVCVPLIVAINAICGLNNAPFIDALTISSHDQCVSDVWSCVSRNHLGPCLPE